MGMLIMILNYFVIKDLVNELSEKLFVKNVILISTEDQDQSRIDSIMLLKQMSKNILKISAILNEKILLKSIWKMDEIPTLFVVIGSQSSKFLSKVSTFL